MKSDREVAWAFQAIYGREPTGSDMTHLGSFGVLEANSDAQLFRRIIGSCDRQFHPTPFIVRFGEADILECKVGGVNLYLDSGDPAVSAGMRQSSDYENHLSSFIEKRLRPGMTFVDIGANIGFFSLLASKAVGPTGHVYAIEPNSENCRLILLSIKKGGIENVSLLPVALSRSVGVAYFTSHQGSNGGLLPSDNDTLLSPNCIVVPTFPLTSLIQRKVDFIKIDVEGAEALAIQGAVDILDRDRPMVSSEFSMEMLRRVSGVDPREYLNIFTQRNYLIMRLFREQERASSNIVDADDLINSMGPVSIEDLVFVPAERASDVGDVA